MEALYLVLVPCYPGSEPNLRSERPAPLKYAIGGLSKALMIPHNNGGTKIIYIAHDFDGQTMSLSAK